jgi:hypothetical protein
VKGTKLVISTLLVIAVLFLTCYSALADTNPYGPMGGSSRTSPFGPAVMQYVPAVENDLTGYNSQTFAQSVGGAAEACEVGFDNLGNAYSYGTSLLACDGCGAQLPATLPGTQSAVIISINPSNPNPACNCASGAVNYPDMVNSMALAGCFGGPITAMFQTVSPGGAAEANAFAGDAPVVMIVTTPGFGADTDCVYNSGLDRWDCADDFANINVGLTAVGLGTEDIIFVDSVSGVDDAAGTWDCTGPGYDPLQVTFAVDENNDGTGTFTQFDQGQNVAFTANNPELDSTNPISIAYAGLDEVVCDYIADAGGQTTLQANAFIDGVSFDISLPVQLGVDPTTSAFVIDPSSGYVVSQLQEPFVYIAPNNPSTLISIQNMGLVNTTLNFTYYDSDCNPHSAPSPPQIRPGQSYRLFPNTNYQPGTVKIESPVQLAVTSSEAGNGLAFYNIYGGQNASNVFDSLAWASAPAGDDEAEVYMINPNNYSISATLEVYSNKKHLGLYAVEIPPYCVKNISAGATDSNNMTIFKAQFSTSGIPSIPSPGNAVLVLRGSMSALEFIPQMSVPILPGDTFKFYEPFAGSNCPIGPYGKTTKNIYNQQNNCNDITVTETFYPYVIGGGAGSLSLGTQEIDYFSTAVFDISAPAPPGTCGSIVAIAGILGAYCDSGDEIQMNAAVFTQAISPGYSDTALSWKVPVLYSIAPPPYCGDGICNNGETQFSCPSDCGVLGFCGDGIVNGPEQCDPPGSTQICYAGSYGGIQTCQSNCMWSVCSALGLSCGDYIVTNPPEECDPPGTGICSGGYCNASCKCATPACGNGVCDPGECGDCVDTLCFFPATCINCACTAATAVCGDTICSIGEVCPIDCGLMSISGEATKEQSGFNLWNWLKSLFS